MGCCIVDGDEIFRVTGVRSALYSRTFSELVRSGDFFCDMRAKSDWFGCRLEGRRRISISSMLHSSNGNGISYVKCLDPYKLGLHLLPLNGEVWVYRVESWIFIQTVESIYIEMEKDSIKPHVLHSLCVYVIRFLKYF